MALTYQAGRRIQGTNVDRVGQSAVSGGWKELGRSSGASQLDVSSLADKRYYMVLFNKPSGNASFALKLNGDGNNNYSRRYSNNGGADTTNTSQSALFGNNLYFGNFNEFMVTYIANKSDKEKLGITHFAVGNTTGSGNFPSRWEGVSKWANTSDAINRIQTQGTMTDSNSEMVVLGWDPDDTHTDNFWEELADVTLGSDASEISSGTITAKKYLWVQIYFHSASNSNDVLVRFNNDTGSNYAHRHAINYGSDTTGTSQSSIKLLDRNGGADQGRFANFFVINNSANEKLLIAHGLEEETSGAGNPPTSNECVAKWANTSSQITEIDCFTESGNLRSGAKLRVWGSN